MAIVDLGWIAWRDAKEQEMPQAWDSKLRLGLAQEAFKAGRAAEKDRAKLNGAAAPEGAQAVVAGDVCIRANSIDLCPSPETRELHKLFGDSEHKLYILTAPPSLGGEDSDRMDWLDKNGMAVRERGNARHNLIVWSPTSEAPYRNIREAIDAARAAGGEGG